MEQPYDYESILPSYFSGKLKEEEKQIIEEWKRSSEENLLIFKNAEKVWKSLNLLREMRTYNTSQALLKVSVSIQREQGQTSVTFGERECFDLTRTIPDSSEYCRAEEMTIEDEKRLLKMNSKIGQAFPNLQKGFLFYWQRIAAVLLLPLLLLGSIYFFLGKQMENDNTVWQTITTPPGVKSQTQLPDGTKVWLNSESKLSYPSSFTRHERNVKLEGEAYFEVAKDKRHPFYVDLGTIGIEVTGTAFNAINYEDEKQTEVILTSGKVRLLGQKESKRYRITEMDPGQKAVYKESANKIFLQQVDTEKYVSWIYGRLIFRDDPMTEVIRRLDRWFSVDIEIEDPEIAQYIYTATFREETIEQILNLLKRTSPVEYSIIPVRKMDDGSFERQKIILKKRQDANL
jgi:transmembrane sensor